jgi:DNA-binding NarL/FixJ family response regulator
VGSFIILPPSDDLSHDARSQYVIEYRYFAVANAIFAVFAHGCNWIWEIRVNNKTYNPYWEKWHQPKAPGVPISATGIITRRAMNLSNPETKPRLVLADDHALVRYATKSIVEMLGNCEVVGEASNGKEAIAITTKLKPDLVLMDINMLVLNGIDATRELKRRNPKIPVLIRTISDTINNVLDAVRAGAAGYLFKDASPAEFVASVQLVLAGDSTMSAEEAHRILKRLAFDHEKTISEATTPDPITRGVDGEPMSFQGYSSLTNQEHETLKLLAKGMTNPQIAMEMHLSNHTVKGYVESIIHKLGVSDRTQAEVRAVSLGLVREELRTT